MKYVWCVFSYVPYEGYDLEAIFPGEEEALRFAEELREEDPYHVEEVVTQKWELGVRGSVYKGI